MRLWMENSFLWLANQFGQENIYYKPTILPDRNYFPIAYNGSERSLLQTAEIVAGQMEIDVNSLNLKTYRQNIQEVGDNLGNLLFTEIDNTTENQMAAGMYFGTNEEGKFDVFIEEANLYHPENLVAVLAHEFAHIKILGENRLTENCEDLTDLCTVVFGFGIFNANASFNEVKTMSMWGHKSLGYLKQQEWGYALALYAHFRQEENPEWLKYLSPNLKSDFMKSQKYILANMEKIFWEEYKPE